MFETIESCEEVRTLEDLTIDSWGLLAREDQNRSRQLPFSEVDLPLEVGYNGLPWYFLVANTPHVLAISKYAWLFKVIETNVA